MEKKLPILLLTLAVLVGLSGGYVLVGLQAYASYQHTSLASQEHCGGQSPVQVCVRTPTAIFSAFYPSYVANQYPLFIVTYRSDKPITLVLSVTIIGFSQTRMQTVNATVSTQSTTFTPPLTGQVLRTFTTESNTSVRVQVTDTNKHLYYLNDSPLRLHSRWVMQWIAANRLKIAAWVTPNTPEITTLMRKAQHNFYVQLAATQKAMSGYSNASRKGVIAQVNAIYDTLLLDYHMKYLQASVPYTGTDDTAGATQNIKLPAEILQQHSGMCIELTLLLASAIEHIGLHTEIVLIPGHAFLGVAVTPDEKHFEFWDAVQINNNIAGDSANTAADTVYTTNRNNHTILDTILISDARKANIEAMI
ncbi:MAG: hypothetical protein M3Z24_09475 [Chloroflexota bacterium]|nr:hypothetical protein [Chloroflexota bacterium]